MRILCILLAIIVFALCTVAGVALGRVAAPLSATFVSYDANLIQVLCLGGGAFVGLLAASGFLISASLVGRVRDLEDMLEED